MNNLDQPFSFWSKSWKANLFFWLPWYFLISLAMLGGFAKLGLCAVPESVALPCLIGEASGEGKEGMQAVAEVLRIRGSTKGFYGCKASHVQKEPKYVWKQAKQAWEASETSNLTHGATHFESIDFKTPKWAKDMKETAKIGKHIFYSKK